MSSLATSFRAAVFAAGVTCIPAHVGATPDGNRTSAEAAQAVQPAQWRTVATHNTPHARHENSMVAIDDRLYLLGGRDDRPLEIFDTTTQRWSQGATPPLMVNHAQAVVSSGKLYVVGGFSGNYPEEASLTNMLIYDPKTDHWQVGPEIPTQRRRGAAGTVEHAGVLYLVGGNTRGHMSGYVPWLDAFDTRTQQWTQLPDAPHARDHFHAVVLDGKLYAAGGRRSAHESGNTLAQTIGEVDVYDIAQRSWTVAPAALPTPRAGTAAIARDGRLLVMGGESTRQVKAHEEVEAYDPRTARWTTLPTLPQGRHGTQAAAVKGDVYLAAGSANRGGGPELEDVLVLPKLQDTQSLD
ncbi:kelch repeat-containing protein [Xanthomonas campestris pv. campestris]|uniref:Kelch repeat-containing protein n=1 Tax=Xanthomonas campestris TaxID=339 RepID=UPI00094AFE82|nr:kelch repeat-containing protein [Xanthomonas campestris]MEA0698441.1 kelch repeat-containing protein [Xanthomonas campestris pv. campestris]MEA0777357.1 kelch repeat-containing protein [Xanthomonas campestris pv. campestris]MEA0785547.1 kelch repeat-containing protein [Xanthomonas campestris pv. campestris]MEA0859898.1 kelch repeat-containing protein [Xanthomonas campestris pv. campestris]MEA0942459.1 kelch repeat-containing protein [Xanthomonas campestris pv. campestris]